MVRNITEKETARTWGVSVAWLRHKRREGGGPNFVKLDNSRCGKVLYPVEELDKYFTSKLTNSIKNDGGQHA